MPDVNEIRELQNTIIEQRRVRDGSIIVLVLHLTVIAIAYNNQWSFVAILFAAFAIVQAYTLYDAVWTIAETRNQLKEARKHD